MEKSISTLDRTIQTPFLISYANVRDIDEEWNLIKWNKEHKEIDCHRLYFRSDNGDAKATLTLIDGKVELLPNKIYFIPAYSVLQSEIKGTMHKYYIHFRTDSPLLNLYRFFSNKFSVDAPAFTEMLFSTIVENYTKNSPVCPVFCRRKVKVFVRAVSSPKNQAGKAKKLRNSRFVHNNMI